MGNPDDRWTQDCPPQNCPPVGNPEVGNPDIHRRNRSNWSRIVRLTINWSCIVEALARKTLLWRHAILKTKQGLKVYHKQSKYHYSVTKSVNVPRIWVRTSPPDMAINVWDVFAHWYVLAYITNISSATGFHSHTHCITSKKKKGANQSNFNQPGV